MDYTNPKIEDYVTAPLELGVFNAVVARPYGLTVDEIVDALYGHREDGGPEYARNIVSTRLVSLNRKLKPLGMRIKGWGGPGSKFHLYIRRTQ